MKREKRGDRDNKKVPRIQRKPARGKKKGKDIQSIIKTQWGERAGQRTVKNSRRSME